MKNTFFRKGLMTLAVISGSAIATIASAQAPSAIDLGTLPRCPISRAGTVANAGDVVWYKFTLPSAGVDASAGTYLDMDTEQAAATAVGDTMLALFDGTGNFIVIDDDDGSGLLSQLTFGLTSPARPAVGTGLPYDGRDGATLAGGDYYAAVFAYSFTRTVQTPWTVTTASTATGNVNLRINYGPAIGAVSGTPTVFTNLGTLASDGNFLTNTTSLGGANNVRWFKFTLGTGVDRANRTYLDIDTEQTTGITNTALALFNGSTGALVASDTVSGSGNLSQLSFGTGLGRPGVGDGSPYSGRNGTTLAAGDYYIAVAAAPAQFTTNFGFSSCTGASSSNVKVRVRTGTVSSDIGPPTVRDFGTLTTAAPYTESIPVTGSEIKWVKFTLASALPGNNFGYLDMDTEGTTGITDTEMGLYTGAGVLVNSDDDSGSGLLSALSYGATFPVRPSSAGGDNFVGQSGTLSAGTYYLAVGVYNVTFNPADFDVTSTGTAAGTIVVNLRLGNGSAVTPPSDIAADLGIVTASNSPRRTPDLTIGAAQFVWVKFATPADTNATDRFVDIQTDGSAITAGTFGANDTEIGVYNTGGTLVATNDDWSFGTPVVRESGLTWGQTAPTRDYGVVTGMDGRTGAVLPAGTYYIAAGAYNMNFAGAFGVTATNTQTGTVKVTVATNFGGQTGCNAADITNLGGSGGPDGQLTVDDLIKYLSWFLTGDIRADLTNLGGQGAPDGQLTADDLIRYLNLFLTGTGC